MTEYIRTALRTRVYQMGYQPRLAFWCAVVAWWLDFPEQIGMSPSPTEQGLRELEESFQHHQLVLWPKSAQESEQLTQEKSRWWGKWLERFSEYCRDPVETVSEQELWPESVQKSGAVLTSFLDPSYPQRLLTLADPPPALWSTGPLWDWEHVRSVAVVGSRTMTPYGQWAAQVFAKDLVRKYGYVIVSGCARGVDATAQWAALKAGGSTIGVLGGGLESAAEHTRLWLQQDIKAKTSDSESQLVQTPTAQRTLLITEFWPGMPPTKWQFRQRNRLIAGLASAVLVVEGGEQSGTLITAHAANDQGNLVAVVPHSLWSANAGATFRLWSEGAHVVRSAAELHGLLQPSLPNEALTPAAFPAPSLSPLALRLWQILCEHSGSLLLDRARQLWERSVGKSAAPQWSTIYGELLRTQRVQHQCGVVSLQGVVQS